MKVLISGGGIAGNALAFWLCRLGHEVTVVERSSSLRTSGLQIDLRGHGIEVLKRMGLEQAFRSHAAPEKGWEIVDSAGKRKAYFPANTSGEGTQSMTSDFEIMREDLVRLLYEANKDNTKYIFGTTVEGYTEKDDGQIQVRYSDGKVDVFDLLVGADGQWSHTRKLMFGTEGTDSLTLLDDTVIAYFTMARDMKPGDDFIATQYVAPGSRSFMIRRHKPDVVQVYIGCKIKGGPMEGISLRDIKGAKKAFAQIFRGAGWITDDVLRGMEAATDMYCERPGVVQLPSWSKGNAVLLGDAAYAPSVSTGMGTTSGVVGAYILAGEIARHCPSTIGELTSTLNGGNDKRTDAKQITAALRAYDNTFRPYMNQVQEGVLEQKNDFIPKSSFGIAVFHLLAGIASFLKLNMMGFMFKEKVKNWALPDYEEMAQISP